ncbi:hypothetical protein BX600DRAFT_439856 [Xylariales sp. PMI_506]|nr:hypothetical protein BX600DRAFT_439856 [Xylariales sp. PMI_506]
MPLAEPNVLTESNLKSGPEGAVSGSQWACRETFVAIVVANLPILQPLIRRGANKIGLSTLFSRTTKMGQSHPLESNEAKDDRYELARRNQAPPRGQGKLAAPWESQEQILRTVGDATSKQSSICCPGDHDIVVAHSTSNTHEVVDNERP